MKTTKTGASRLALVLSALALIAAAPASADERLSDLDILKSYAANFERDPSLTEATTFGVEIGDKFYTVDATPAANTTPAQVSVKAGAPKTPTFYFKVESSDYLNKVYRGEVNALTSMAKAFSSDYAPMDIDAMEGFTPAEDFGATVVPFTFHFWTKGLPEIVPFAPEMTRETHGANAGVFYYQPGLRSAWFDIRPGQHVNEDEKSRDNPFPSMLILTRGEVTAIIGGVETTFREGSMMFIPAGVSHEFINNGDKPAFGFLFMFGDGA
jgi:mannose-6-phosphate isomerase-like protein (cupin superfamily)